MPTSTMVEMLTPIWQRVLRLSSVDVEDNFFDLGGDSSLALQLFNEIPHACGRDLPPVTICYAPTIAALAVLLEQPTTPRVPPLIQLKAGSEEPPVFITHGLGSSVMELLEVVKHMQTPQAIHGMQARGIDGVDEPLDRIEDMARYSLDAVKKLQPHGPYLLIGYSLGGLVTMEMARQLSENGERIALLVMLDSYPHKRYLSPGQRARMAVRLTSRQVPRKLKWWLRAGTPDQAAVDVSLSPAMQRCRDSAYLALERYQPRFYPGTIKFVRAATSTDFPANPTAVWAELVNQFELETVPGNHFGIMTTHSEKLASAISRYVEEALR